MGMKEWLHFAAQPQVVRRALKFGVVVGAILVAINHGSALMEGDDSPGRWVRIGLTVLVPYLVSTASSVCAMKDRPRGLEADRKKEVG